VLNSNGHRELKASSIAYAVFPQMLEALDCLAFHGIIHRDVKPQNILYTSLQDGKFQFQLGSFGLCNSVVNAETKVGTPNYIAPETFDGRQSSKSDVWSLFVMMLWTLDVGPFRQNQFLSNRDARESVLHAGRTAKKVSKIREMAIVDVDERASAAQMFVKNYNSAGLTTPLKQVPDLAVRPFPSAASTTEALDRLIPPIQPSDKQIRLKVPSKDRKPTSPANPMPKGKKRAQRTAHKSPNRTPGVKDRGVGKEENIVRTSSLRQMTPITYPSEMDISPPLSPL
jgi:serine/threonine protein kinase